MQTEGGRRLTATPVACAGVPASRVRSAGVPPSAAGCPGGRRQGTLIRYARLHFGDWDAGRTEIDKAWVQALDVLLDLPEIDREFVHDTLRTKDAATLAHLVSSLHFALVRSTGEWIHEGNL